MIRNWNEESKSVKTPTEIEIEIEEFYNPYMDQYNARRKTLERLIEIYVEYYKDVTPIEALNTMVYHIIITIMETLM